MFSMSSFVSKLFSKSKKSKNSPVLVDVAPVSFEAGAYTQGYRKPVDEDTDVRLHLAERLCELFPTFSCENLSRLYAFIVQTLGSFALDEILKIRLALSSTLRDFSDFSPREVSEFVRETEQDISEPILRFCAGLQDSDLISILSLHSDPAFAQAVYSLEREKTLPPVIDMRGEINPEDIVLSAKETKEWKDHSSVHAEVPEHVASELAQFIDSAVRDILRDRAKLDYETIEDIVSTFRDRMILIDLKNNQGLGVQDRLEYILKNGGLGNGSILNSLAIRDAELVIHGLSVLSGARVKVIEDVVAARAPSPLVALCWKAGLSARLALVVQRDLAEISQRRLIFPKNGTDFSLSEKEMREQLDFLGVKG